MNHIISLLATESLPSDPNMQPETQVDIFPVDGDLKRRAQVKPMNIKVVGGLQVGGEMLFSIFFKCHSGSNGQVQPVERGEIPDQSDRLMPVLIENPLITQANTEFCLREPVNVMQMKLISHRFLPGKIHRSIGDADFIAMRIMVVMGFGLPAND